MTTTNETRRAPSRLQGARVPCRQHSRRALSAVAVAVVGLVAFSLSLAGTTSPVGAVGNGQWAVDPSGPDGPGDREHFVYTLKPGQVFQDTVALSNLSDEPRDFLIFPTDAYTVPGEGGFAALREGEEPESVGTWIEMPTRTITVEGGTRADIPFQIVVPPDAEPGDHAGAILAVDALQGDVEDPDAEGLGVSIRQRVGSRVYVRVDGPLQPALEVEEFRVDYENPTVPIVQSGTVEVQYEVRNSGNLRLTPEAELKIKAPFGVTLKTIEARELPEMLPDGRILVTETIDGVPPVGRLTAEVSLRSRTGEGDVYELTRSTTVTAMPWLLVAFVLLAIGVLFGWRWWRRRPVGAPPAPPDPTDRSRKKEPVPA